MSIEEKLRSFINDADAQVCPVWEYAFIKPSDITFAQSVRDACAANICGKYGKSWTCPPGVGDWQDLRDHFMTYSNVLVFTTCHTLEDSFDFEGMMEGKKAHDELDESILDLLADETDPYELTGVESCARCEKCTYPDAPCRFPHRARKAMEACGINVVKLAADCGIRYMNGQNTVTYFSAVFW